MQGQVFFLSSRIITFEIEPGGEMRLPDQKVILHMQRNKQIEQSSRLRRDVD